MISSFENFQGGKFQVATKCFFSDIIFVFKFLISIKLWELYFAFSITNFMFTNHLSVFKYRQTKFSKRCKVENFETDF